MGAAARMREGSTWAGVAAMLAALAPSLSVPAAQMAATAGAMLAGSLAVVLRERGRL